jgi:hypothetical protein
MSEEIHGPELRALEAKLAALQPTGRIDRDQVLFRAGQLSVGPRAAWGWRCATGMLAVVSVALAGVVVLRPTARPLDRVAQQPPPPRRGPEAQQQRPPAQPAPEPPSPQPARPADQRMARAGRDEPWPDPTGPRALEQQVLRWGLGAIPPPRATASAEPPLSVEGLLGRPRKYPAKSGVPFPANIFPHGDRS